MQKVYLLLRNNKQTGPHSLDELLHLGLKPFDLIWVEGKSFGWSYPSEVDSLKSFVAQPTPSLKTESSLQPATSQAAQTSGIAVAGNKKIFVSFPAGGMRSVSPPATQAPAVDMIEQKAEALRKRALAYAPQDPLQKEEVIKTTFARSLSEVEEDYAGWVYKKKAKRKPGINKKQLAIAAIVAIGLTGGWWAGKAVFSNPLNAVPQLALKYNTAELKPEKNNTDLPVKNVSVSNQAIPLTQDTYVAKKKIKEQKATTKKPVPKKNTVIIPEVQETKINTEPEQNTVVVIPEEKKPLPPAAGEPKKKKTLKELIRGIFGKKKNKPAAEDAKPADNSNNERTATRRSEETPSAPVIINLADQVDIKMNTNDADWMMGVQGLKLTLFNRSKMTLKKAAVELSYYSDQNTLLEKKVIYFSNVSAGKKQTVAAADHRLADHVEYTLLSASGESEAYVKQ